MKRYRFVKVEGDREETKLGEAIGIHIGKTKFLAVKLPDYGNRVNEVAEQLMRLREEKAKVDPAWEDVFFIFVHDDEELSMLRMEEVEE